MNRLGATIVRRDAASAIAEYRELKKTDPGGYDFGEGRLNNLGNMLLQRKRTADAIAIFTLNAEEYPRSANAYDSPCWGSSISAKRTKSSISSQSFGLTGSFSLVGWFTWHE